MPSPIKAREIECPRERFALIFFTAMLAILGCRGREHYRRQADQDAYCIIQEKSVDPRWAVEDFRVLPPVGSRFADPQCPDHPCMPEDDPAAWYLSPKPQVTRFVKPLHEGGGYLDRLPELPPMPEPESGSKSPPPQRDPLLPEGSVPRVLTPLAAYEVGVLNSRDFQDRRESLYLAALDVSLERFAFGPQFFGTQSVLYEHLGRRLPGGDRPNHLVVAPGPLPGNVVAPGASPGSAAPDGQSISRFSGRGPLAGSGFGVGRLFNNGGALLLRFANQTVFEFTGPLKGTFSQSELGMDVVQPLLRGGGKAATLEPLTQVERNLLYELRSFARFQREFFVSVATGASLSQGARLEVSQQTDDDARTRRRVGLLPLIEQLQILRNEEHNLERLQAHLKRFEALHRAEEVSLIQVDQVRQDLAQARSRVIRARRRYYDNLDRFKLQLGLPTEIPLVLDESLLAQFELNEENCKFTRLTPELDAFEYEPPVAEELAVENRLDLMNAHGLLNDHWRKIAVSANGLMGVLDLEYHGSLFTPDLNDVSRPLSFSHRTARHRVSVKGELPLVRRRERNLYRATLIEYQQARRQLMLAEDTVRLEVRTELRELARARESFEIQFGAVVLACRRVDQTRRILELPPRANEERELGTNSARNLLEAQADLVDAQNDLVESWVDFQTARLELLRDLEILDVRDTTLLAFGGSEPEEVPEPSEPDRI